ncbi:MAG: beta-ketoacyl-[acyl-carrier-protein] synthase family protein [Alphaproteobacteria bacterium]|nr:MAG: beta-ketoacyl-[acyl-carrier-protein] synthase family protein [Alphaproteobacteria bacterium]
MTSGFYLNALGLINSLGAGKDAVAKGLMAGDTGGMGLMDGIAIEGPAFVGAVKGPLPEIDPAFREYDSRNNRLLLAALNEIEPEIRSAIDRFGPDRIAVILGTSTSGISDNEPGIAVKVAEGDFPDGFDYARQENGNLSLFVRKYFGLTGPAMTISTACTSSAKTLSSARRLIRAGLCDCAIVGGADTLGRLTINGFGSLDLLSETLCNPFSRNRNGINIGEGAAVFLMSREEGPVRVKGIGESSDAYHMSTPDPEGAGAKAAMAAALEDASLEAADIGYLNLHGTATVLNDSMEGTAVASLFPGGVPCSSTKPLTGHTLGAAGATELAFLWLALQNNYSNGALPPHIWDGEVDPDLPPLDLVARGRMRDPAKPAMMSNSFAFGGSNISVILTEGK